MVKPIISAQQAAELIQSGWIITTGGFGSCGHPEILTRALKERFLTTGLPRDLGLIFSAGQGDKNERGLNQLAYDGLIKKIIGGYWALTSKLGEMTQQGRMEAYNWPQCVISHLFRVIADGKPGVVSPVGLHTFVDPRQEGRKLNQQTQNSLVELISLRGEKQLFKKFVNKIKQINFNANHYNANKKMFFILPNYPEPLGNSSN